MTTRPRLTPEAEHLAEQERLLEELTEQLTAKEAEFAETGSAFARFRAEYLRRFAPLYAELDRLEAENRPSDRSGGGDASRAGEGSRRSHPGGRVPARARRWGARCRAGRR